MLQTEAAAAFKKVHAVHGQFIVFGDENWLVNPTELPEAFY